MRALLILCTLTGCTAILGMNTPERSADPDAAIDIDAAIDSSTDAAPAGYHATAVRFDSSAGDYLTTGTLAGSTGSAQGVVSVWLRFNAGDGSQQLVAAAQVVAAGGIFKNSSNKIQFQFNQCNGALLLDMQTAHAYTASSGWIHILAAWDVSANKAQIYVNGVPDLAANATISNGSICYNAPKWGIGGLSSGTLDADVADWYASFGTFIDLDVVANRARFGGPKPIDLAADCSNPTGATPIACLTGALAQWPMNKGTGGGFAVHGNGLAAAPTSPSD